MCVLLLEIKKICSDFIFADYLVTLCLFLIDYLIW